MRIPIRELVVSRSSIKETSPGVDASGNRVRQYGPVRPAPTSYRWGEESGYNVQLFLCDMGYSESSVGGLPYNPYEFTQLSPFSRTRRVNWPARGDVFG